MQYPDAYHTIHGEVSVGYGEDSPMVNLRCHGTIIRLNFIGACIESSYMENFNGKTFKAYIVQNRKTLAQQNFLPIRYIYYLK